MIPKLGTKLKEDVIPLDYTPRKFVTHPENQYFYLVEGDNRTLGEGAAQETIQKLVCRLGFNPTFSPPC